MKGKNHIRMGACTVGVVSAVGIVPFASQPVAVAAGIGLFLFAKVAPDLDHPGSGVTRSWGWLTRVYSWALVRPFAKWVYNTTRGPGDKADAGVHRGFTHTWPGGAFGGCLLALAMFVGPVWAAVTLGLCLGAAARVYDRGLLLYGAAAGAGIGWFAWADIVIGLPWFVVVFAIGCLAHAVDDCLTSQGAPLWFPRYDVDTKKRWTKVGPPEWMRFNTGSGFETALVWSAMIATTGLLYFTTIAPWLGPILLEMRNG